MKDYRRLLESCRNALYRKEVSLERGKYVNEQRSRLKQQLDEVEKLSGGVRQQIQRLNNLSTTLTLAQNDFCARRVAFLEDKVTEAVAVIYPEENFKAKINYNFSYGSSKAQLLLVDAKGRSRLPGIQEGKLCQYLMSFASTVAAVASLGTNIIFIDEAFGVSSDENLPKVGELLAKYAELGIQFIGVSQRSALYDDIPCKKFVFHKEISAKTEEENKVVLDEVRY